MNPEQQFSQSQWHNIRNKLFCNFLGHLANIPTFRRNQQSSHIEYMFGSIELYQQLTNTKIEYVSPTSTDHALLSATLSWASSTTGKGIWRANPALASSPIFLDSMHQRLSKLCASFTTQTTLQEQWDQIKTTIAKTARSYGRKHVAYQKQQLAALQEKRVKTLEKYRECPAKLHYQLARVEKPIQHVQEEFVANDALRARKFWREKGESWPSFLKRSISQRRTQQFFPELSHPVTLTPCHTPDELTDAANTFYQALYTSNTVDTDAIDSLWGIIDETSRLSPSDADSLLREFPLEEIIDAARRYPKHSSPGMDGLPYQILFHVLHNQADALIALQVYNAALLHSTFPTSWSKTCMVLLPIKGDLRNLSNRHPISLINTDAKIFTRLVNSRLMSYFNHLIRPQQMSFMPNRFIGENGKTIQTVMSLAEHTSSNAIGLLLDQEKAYDRIHPHYLERIMHAFGFPAQLISSITQLFFKTKIHININGHLSSPVLHHRGLRQGNLLSTLLFNIAFDPFLRSIQQSTRIRGFVFDSVNDQPAPDPLRVLAYADDDTLVLLSNEDDFFLPWN